MLKVVKKNLEKDKFYIENVEKLKEFRTAKTFETNETTKPINMLHDNDIITSSNMKVLCDFKKDNVIYYISDLHLDHKIAKKFPKPVSKEKIVNYIRAIVKEIAESLGNLFFNKYFLIAGDVSHSFEISKIFYKELANIQSIFSENIIVVLGNHELWESGNVNIAINKYRELFQSLKITFLNNEVLYVKGKGLAGQFFKLTESEIENSSEEELRDKCINSKLTILGGIGFSGLNNKYNSESGLYRNTVKTFQEDKELSLRFEKIYLKLKKALDNNELIVLTHTPKNDWSKDSYKTNWIYVNGHTHMNEYYKDNERIVYADNQIGYYNNKITAKYFISCRKYDIFKYYDDGIYQIGNNEYIDFVYGMGIYMEYNRKDGIINMLKKEGIYCFILEDDKKRLYLLDGGKRCKLSHGDINYYYENMSFYSNKIKDSTKRFNNYMVELSNYIKSFGGYGTIHGCIIDIDFYNHLYINPYDGKVTPYYAESIIDKYIYKDLAIMLSAHCPELYKNYKMLNESNSGIILKNNNEIKMYDFVNYKDTLIYRESRIIKKLQYLINDNIIRIWNDDLIEGKESFESLCLEQSK